MASGPEVLLKTLFKALGLNPAEFVQGLQGFMQEVFNKLESFDQRMTAQELLLRRAVMLLEMQASNTKGAAELSPDAVPLLSADIPEEILQQSEAA